MCENGNFLIKYATEVIVVAKAKTVADSLLLYYSVTPGKGRLVGLPNELKSKLDKHKKVKFPQAIYYPSPAANEPQVIYFSSYGKTDLSGMNIWKTEKISDGEWGQPAGLPKEINSGGDEIFPIPAQDGAILYFASNNLYGMGGYDIFKTTYDSVAHRWTNPENLGFPINSTYDDFFFVPNSKGDTAIFASNREVAGDSVVVYKVALPNRSIKKSLSGLGDVTNMQLPVVSIDLVPLGSINIKWSSINQSLLDRGVRLVLSADEANVIAMVKAHERVIPLLITVGTESLSKEQQGVAKTMQSHMLQGVGLVVHIFMLLLRKFGIGKLIPIYLIRLSFGLCGLEDIYY